MSTVPSFPNLLVFKTKYFIKFNKATFRSDNLHFLGSTYKTYFAGSVWNFFAFDRNLFIVSNTRKHSNNWACLKKEKAIQDVPRHREEDENKKFSSKFPKGDPDWQITEEGQIVQWLRHCDNKDINLNESKYWYRYD